MSQFFYKRVLPPSAAKQELVLVDSFNTEMVIRSWMSNDGTITVLLNDGHEESIEVENPKNPKGEPQRKREYYNSQIVLSVEDAARFQSLTTAGGIIKPVLPTKKAPALEKEEELSEIIEP